QLEGDVPFVLDDQDARSRHVARIHARALLGAIEWHHDGLWRYDFERALQRIDKPLLAKMAVGHGAEVGGSRLQHGETKAVAGWRRGPRATGFLPHEPQLTWRWSRPTDFDAPLRLGKGAMPDRLGGQFVEDERHRLGKFRHDANGRAVDFDISAGAKRRKGFAGELGKARPGPGAAPQQPMRARNRLNAAVQGLHKACNRLCALA